MLSKDIIKSIFYSVELYGKFGDFIANVSEIFDKNNIALVLPNKYEWSQVPIYDYPKYIDSIINCLTSQELTKELNQLLLFVKIIDEKISDTDKYYFSNNDLLLLIDYIDITEDIANFILKKYHIFELDINKLLIEKFYKNKYIKSLCYFLKKLIKKCDTLYNNNIDEIITIYHEIEDNLIEYISFYILNENYSKAKQNDLIIYIIKCRMEIIKLNKIEDIIIDCS